MLFTYTLRHMLETDAICLLVTSLVSWYSVRSVFVEPALSAFADGYNSVYPVMRLPLVPVRDKFQQLYLLVQPR